MQINIPRINNIQNSVMAKMYSKLFLITDNSNWSLSWDIKELNSITDQLKIDTTVTKNFGFIKQSVFYASKYILMNPMYYLFFSSFQTRIGFSYFHGYPNSKDSTAITCYKNLKKYQRHISRIQVSHSKMKHFVLDTKIDSKKVFLIPIGINQNFFTKQTHESKNFYRKRFGIPQQAVVIGSFHKDGVGMGKGIEPKLIKGPDILIKSLEILKNKIPEIFVLLSGPARGYVKVGLEKLNIPYRHIILDHYPDINQLFQCIDVYIIPSREEGGPKAILESMISGVPLVTTRVGQAMDLVEHEKNGMMVSVEDYEGLAFYTQKILQDSDLTNRLIENGLLTANSNTYSSQIPLWKSFFNGFVKMNID